MSEVRRDRWIVPVLADALGKVKLGFDPQRTCLIRCLISDEEVRVEVRLLDPAQCGVKGKQSAQGEECGSLAGAIRTDQKRQVFKTDFSGLRPKRLEVRNSYCSKFHIWFPTRKTCVAL